MPYATAAVTTFSSFTLDTLTLSQGGQHAAAFWNVAAQMGLGLLAVFGGYYLGGRLGVRSATIINSPFRLQLPACG